MHSIVQILKSESWKRQKATLAKQFEKKRLTVEPQGKIQLPYQELQF